MLKRKTSLPKKRKICLVLKSAGSIPMKRFQLRSPLNCHDDFVRSFLIFSKTNRKWSGCARPWIRRTCKPDLRDNPLYWSLLVGVNGAQCGSLNVAQLQIIHSYQETKTTAKQDSKNLKKMSL